jgi:pyrroloquinoline quinone (PQQ) biosynthesis protein C
MTKTRPQELAVAEVEKQVEAIYRELLRFPWASRNTYAAWLAQTYFYVRRVSHVLAAAAARTPLDEPRLHEHFLRGISEEKGHEALATQDLSDLGFSIERFSEHPLTTAYYQTLFHMIETAGSAAILGYFFVLEGVAGVRGKALYDAVIDAYQGRAGAFLREHVMLDAEHYPKALALLNSLTDAQALVVHESAKLAGPLYRYMVATVHAESLASD